MQSLAMQGETMIDLLIYRLCVVRQWMALLGIVGQRNARIR